MRKLLFPLLICLSITGNSQTTPSPESEKLYQSTMRQIRPSHSTWVKQTAIQVNNQKMDDAAIRARANEYAALNKIIDQMSIDMLVFLVMMQASKDQQEDLKSLMDEVKSNNKKKEDLRKLKDEVDKNGSQINRLRLDSINVIVATIDRPVVNQSRTKTVANNNITQNKNLIVSKPVNKQEVENAKDTIKNKLDSLSEMGETLSLRLQLYQDRRSKFLNTLSNIMKKISDTANSIIQNLK